MKVAWLLILLVCLPLVAADPPCSPQQRAAMQEWDTLMAYPEVENPAKVVRPGDVLVYLLPPERESAKDPMLALLAHKPHASLVVRNKEGKLGRLESPAILGHRFVPFDEAMLEVPYLLLRPKWEGKLAETFSSRTAFENEINRAGEILEKLKYAYDSELVLEILNPEYRARLRDKFSRACLTSSDVSNQYCSELPLTALTMVGLEVTDGVPVSDLVPNIKNVMRYYPEKDHDSVIDKISKDFVEEMTSANRGQTQALKFEASEISDALDAARALQKKCQGNLSDADRLATVSRYIESAKISTLRLGLLELAPLISARTRDAIFAAVKARVSFLQKEQIRVTQAQFAKTAELLVIEQSRKVFVAALKKKLKGEKLTPAEDGLFSRKIIRPHDLITLTGKDWKFEVVGKSMNGMNCPAGGTPGTHPTAPRRGH